MRGFLGLPTDKDPVGGWGRLGHGILNFFGKHSGGPLTYMTPPPGTEQALSLIAQYESGFNPLAKNPKSTASGEWQFIDSTWREYAKLIPGASQFATARDAPERIQHDVAAQALAHEGFGPWSSNSRLIAALEGLRHDLVQIASSANVQQAPPVNIKLHGHTGGQVSVIVNAASGGVA
jgi:hypothetical protein